MVASSPSAANVCLPEISPVICTYPPLPSPTRGVRCSLEGNLGRCSATASLSLLYGSGKSVVIRPLRIDSWTVNSSKSITDSNSNNNSKSNGNSVSVSNRRALVYRSHLYPVTTCQAAPSGAYICSGDERGVIKIWAADTLEHLTKYETALLTGPVRDISWDVESKRLVIGGERSDAYKSSDCAKAISWDGVSAGVLAQMTKGRVSSVAFKPTRPFRIAIAGMDEPKIAFHQGPPFARIPSSNGVPNETAHTRGGITALSYSSDGLLLISAGVDRSICLYDGKTMELLCKHDAAHAATIYDVAFDASNSRILTASGDGTAQLFEIIKNNGECTLAFAKVWKVAEHQAVGTYAQESKKVPIGGVQVGCTFCGDTPVSVSFNGQIIIMKPDGGFGETLTGHTAPIAGLAVVAGCKSPCFFTGDTNGVICEWDLASTQPTRRLQPPSGNADLLYTIHGTSDRPAAIAAIASIGTSILYSVGWDDNLYVTRNGIVEATPTALTAQPRCMSSGTNLAVIGTVKGLWIVHNGKLASNKLLATTYEPNAVSISPKDDMVYVGGNDCKIYVYKITTLHALELKRVINGKHLKPIHSIALSPDGNKLAAGDEKDIIVYDVHKDFNTIVGRGRWCFHLQRITCLAWSPDSLILASGGSDDSLYIWKIENKATRVHYPFCHRGGFTGLAFIGKREMLSCGADSVVHYWNVTQDVAEKLD